LAIHLVHFMLGTVVPQTRSVCDFVMMIISLVMSRNSLVSLVTGYGLCSRGHILGKGKAFLS